MVATKHPRWWCHRGIKWLLISVVALLIAWLVIAMYVRGEYLFAILSLTLASTGLYVFASGRAYAWRYVYPGLAGMGLFVLFPLVCTVAIAFTNYSSVHQLTFERARTVLLEQQNLSGKPYNFGLYPVGNQWRLALTLPAGGWLVSPAFSFAPDKAQILPMTASPEAPVGERATLRGITQNRLGLGQLVLQLPDDTRVRMSSLRQFSSLQQRYIPGDGLRLTDSLTGVVYRPDNSTGFYRAVGADGRFGDNKLSPGYTVSVGWHNFLRVLNDQGIQKPFLSIFVWTIVFSLLTVVLTVALGMVLACLVQWEALKGRAIYRMMLILPYAVPSFISILIFKGLFNQSFGEINIVLHALFGIQPSWFNDPTLARVMLVAINTWLGYPYMMILCMGLLKSIPDDLYEASAMDGAGPFQNFFRITLPMLIKPLTPLMIASFAFNFNNFVLIQLLTNGGPDRINATTPAGYTDLLVSYTYRIAFEGAGGQDFGLAAAIATIIFLLVGGLALLNLKATRMTFD
ncbi:maltose ABC transporter permease MalF [Acerihabitans sp. TG2]|uniref:maltose ABC transporter permease MalF n=1 Tax=Acerihabitans sp. TG2 TaxID=3096008 RepID=UPI002B22FF10|nr:maltose ABC transporter permease MalF [Acerihabitans sp. TG2]MEA9391513.1 maltose ABC transporter permease MalF [Acerihabitans sp. TG2]